MLAEHGRGAVLKSKLFKKHGNVEQKKGKIAEVRSFFPKWFCWAAAEYVADCHLLWSATGAIAILRPRVLLRFFYTF